MMPKPRCQLNRILVSLLFLTLLGACQSKGKTGDWAELVAPQDTIKVLVAISDTDQRRGFSGVQDADWPDDEGILFLFPFEDVRGFWMPDTHFDLDLFYMDAN